MAKANFDFIKKTTILWQALGFYMERMENASDNIKLTKTTKEGFYIIDINLQNEEVKKTFNNEPYPFSFTEYEKLAQTLFDKGVVLKVLDSFIEDEVGGNPPSELTFNLILSLT